MCDPIDGRSALAAAVALEAAKDYSTAWYYNTTGTTTTSLHTTHDAIQSIGTQKSNGKRKKKIKPFRSQRVRVVGYSNIILLCTLLHTYI